MKQSEKNTILLGQEVILQEALALQKLAQGLGADFAQAVEIIFSLSGRLAVTGMGKSGHIARKIAATLTSTGSPAFFIHPGEASHGDLGAVGPQDAVLALSNSGETHELTDILDYAARRNLPVIGLTGEKQSMLGKQSQCCLLLPCVGEACPLGCAPTSSTTMMLALGDALALALLERRGFTAENFRFFHPGGHLGRRLQLVRDIMHSGEALPLAQADIGMQEALLIMSHKGFGCVALVENSEKDDKVSNGGKAKLLGIISDGDLRRHMSSKLLQQKASDIMTKNPVVIESDAPVGKAVALMNSKNITSLMVVDNGLVQGIVHVHDCLRAGFV